MTSRDFCFWLQGFLEIHRAGIPISGAPAIWLNESQTEMVQKHLRLVFKHEIDPSMPNPELDKIHGQGIKPGFQTHGETLVRC